MSASKYLKVASFLVIALSIALYGSIFFQAFNFMEFQFVLFLLYFAQTFLLLFVVFIVCIVLIDKTMIHTNKIKQGCIVATSIILIGSLVLCGYAYLDCYNSYTPENLFENETKSIQRFYPYHDIENYSKKEKDPIDLSVSHIPGTDYIYLYCYDTFLSNSECDYELEYLESISPFLHFDFWLERNILTQSNSWEIDVYAEATTMKVDGVSFKAYIDGNDYAVLFSRFGKSVYASLLDAPKDVTIEAFAREVIGQIDLLDNATDEKIFLDIPFFQ